MEGEQFQDLLTKDAKVLTLKETTSHGFYLLDLSKFAINNLDHLVELLNMARLNR